MARGVRFAIKSSSPEVDVDSDEVRILLALGLKHAADGAWERRTESGELIALLRKAPSAAEQPYHLRVVVSGAILPAETYGSFGDALDRLKEIAPRHSSGFETIRTQISRAHLARDVEQSDPDSVPTVLASPHSASNERDASSRSPSPQSLHEPAPPMTAKREMPAIWNQSAVAGFALSIISVFLYMFGILPLLAIVFSATGLSQTKGSTRYRGRKLAWAGIIIGSIYVAMNVAVWRGWLN